MRSLPRSRSTSQDGEWTCDCGGKVDPCPHVAAAAIARPRPLWAKPRACPSRPARAAQARLSPRPRGHAAHPGQRHRARRRARGARHVAGRASSRSGRVRELSPTHDDSAHRPHPRPGASTRRPRSPGSRDLFEALSARVRGHVRRRAGRRWRADRCCRARSSRTPRAGSSCASSRDPAVTEVSRRPSSRWATTLRPLGETSTTGELLERLPLVRTFRSATRPSSSPRVLPELEKQARRRRRARRGCRARAVTPGRASPWTSRTRDTRCRSCRRSCTATRRSRASTATALVALGRGVARATARRGARAPARASATS